MVESGTLLQYKNIW